MKCLWIEDFNGETCKSESYTQLESTWISQMGLDKQNLIIKTNLFDALTFIKDNTAEFDCVLLDIRFPVNNGEQRDIDVYKTFFEGTITVEYFNKNIDKATGLLAFNYLIYNVRFPINRIAFFSANIKNKSNYPKLITEIFTLNDVESMKENLYKHSRRTDWTQDKISEIDNLNSKDMVEYWIEKNVATIDEVKGASTDSIITYNEAVGEFNKIGLNLKHGYSKTLDSIKNEKFYDNFILPNKTTYVEVRRAIIEMSLILKPYLKSNKPIISQNKPDNKYEKFYDICYYGNLVDAMLLLPLEIRDDNLSNTKNPRLANKFIKKEIINIVSSLEAYTYDLFPFKDNIGFIILKFIRNWSSHSILKENSYTPEFLAFTIYIAYDFYFDVNILNKNDKTKYNKYRKILSTFFNKEIEIEKSFPNIESVYKYYSNEGKTCRQDNGYKLSYNDLYECYYYITKL